MLYNKTRLVPDCLKEKRSVSPANRKSRALCTFIKRGKSGKILIDTGTTDAGLHLTRGQTASGEDGWIDDFLGRGVSKVIYPCSPEMTR